MSYISTSESRELTQVTFDTWQRLTVGIARPPEQCVYVGMPEEYAQKFGDGIVRITLNPAQLDDIRLRNDVFSRKHGAKQAIRARSLSGGLQTSVYVDPLEGDEVADPLLCYYAARPTTAPRKTLYAEAVILLAADEGLTPLTVGLAKASLQKVAPRKR